MILKEYRKEKSPKPKHISWVRITISCCNSYNLRCCLYWKSYILELHKHQFMKIGPHQINKFIEFIRKYIKFVDPFPQSWWQLKLGIWSHGFSSTHYWVRTQCFYKSLLIYRPYQYNVLVDLPSKFELVLQWNKVK